LGRAGLSGCAVEERLINIVIVIAIIIKDRNGQPPLVVPVHGLGLFQRDHLLVADEPVNYGFQRPDIISREDLDLQNSRLHPEQWFLSLTLFILGRDTNITIFQNPPGMCADRQTGEKTGFGLGFIRFACQKAAPSVERNGHQRHTKRAKKKLDGVSGLCYTIKAR